MNCYKVLNKQIYKKGKYSIVPLRFDDRWNIMKWRNEQIYHLRQSKPLTKEDQDNYFNIVVSGLFEQENPSQILFSFLEDDLCVGYGGIVHINWIDKNAEVSFIMETQLEKQNFEYFWTIYLELIEKVAFEELNLHKLFTYAFDLRPHLYHVLENNGYQLEATLKEHCCIENEFRNVLIHAKFSNELALKKVNLSHLDLTFQWATNPEIRKYAFAKSEITFDEHKQWFLQKINSQNCLYFLAYLNSNAVGSIRFDIVENKAIISYLIQPNFFGKGLGFKLMKIGLERLKSENKEISRVEGKVMNSNIASIKIFEKLNFSSEEFDKETMLFYLNY